MRKTIFLLLIFCFLLLGNSAFTQSGAPVYILPALDRVIIVLGDTPRQVTGFSVFRQNPDSREWHLLTPEPVRQVNDPFRAFELIGPDCKWLAKRVGTLDPPLIWRKLKADRNTTLAFCLISHGLRNAMGRTFTDSNVTPGLTYRYRVELVNMYDKTIKKVEKKIKIISAVTPEPPKDITASAGDGEVTIKWDYRSYRGGDNDRTVGFRIFRMEQGKTLKTLTQTPVLRIEGWLSYIDTGAENGKTYTYLVEAVDIIGTPSERIASAAVTPVDKRPPTIPRGLTAIDRDEGVLLLWKLSPDIDIAVYNVLRNETVRGDYTQINIDPISHDQPRFLDKEINRGTTYYYRLVAVDTSGNISSPSGPASIITLDTEPPPEISGITFLVDAKKRTVTLSWDSVKDPDLLGYNVYKGKTPENKMLLNRIPLKAQASPGYTDKGHKNKGLLPGITLWYGISAVDGSNNESPICLVEVSIPDLVPPKAPLSFSARPTAEGHVALRWQPGLEKDITVHRIFRKQSGSFEQVTEIEKIHTRWTDEDVIRGLKYTYYVTEVDLSGNESEPSKKISVVPTDIHPPKLPENIRVVMLEKGVSLTWTASPSEDTAGYLVYRAEYSGAAWKRLTRKPIIENEYRDKRGKEGMVYGVSAVDTSGNESTKAKAAAEHPEGSKP